MHTASGAGGLQEKLQGWGFDTALKMLLGHLQLLFECLG